MAAPDIEMNKKWISEMFAIEKEDIAVLNNIEQTIKQGGQIFLPLTTGMRFWPAV